ncbi:hypothetical protein TSUD_306730 [Trifolium subterraneum]|uniref:Uncharacterized protein n=1 Tax=Trifolium subterraneum TaxID=3900 RepID=A0A2Z6PE15_TRISU|nr:hypothetical protein TSUD_306730 [Trifolium subterraneum]
MEELQAVDAFETPTCRNTLRNRYYSITKAEALALLKVRHSIDLKEGSARKLIDQCYREAATETD